ncbi:hypothetical protein CJ739_57 [Mariniflexile rhizosphaerae]|uniref:hypothetical protein n=1 Tax=unclassified Mariniflexile TaxID=2643887 RepID=UPI000E33062F|nr:hypothetical protein [Mariniflexile sp. TRM1-10]AXP79157.1 hypothetical protein CJ739_57 [Mariniflexile sp. TRM1-10]
MAYDLYTTEGVFVDNNINAMCNAIMDALINQFDAPTVNAAFGLTGSTAKIIQGEPNVYIHVVPFITNSLPIYDYLKANINTMVQVDGVIQFTDRFQVITPRAYIEVWFKSPLTLVDTNGIFSENKANIANYIL